jgi:hypothetical protein
VIAMNSAVGVPVAVAAKPIAPAGAVAPAPCWARRAAHVAALVALPSSLWRLGLALGFPLGYTDEGLRALVGPTVWGPFYLVALSVLIEIAAVLTLGLVQRWGEVVPRWVPVVGGKNIPRKAVLIPAWIGVAVHTALWTQLLAWWAIPHANMTQTGATVVGFIYLPLVAWAPLMAAATFSYQRRHRR